MLAITYYICEKCQNEYPTKELAEACENYVAEPAFAIGDQVHVVGHDCPSFRPGKRTVEVRKVILTPRISRDFARWRERISLVQDVGHYYQYEIGLCVDLGSGLLVTTAMWLRKTGEAA